MRPPLVLLAEDSEDDVLFLTRALEADGLNLRLNVVPDGARALEALRVERPALLILDLKMPRVGGLEVLREVRASQRLKGIPVVVLSSSFERRDREEAERLGVDLFLRKPADADRYAEIASQVRIVLAMTGALK